MTFDTVRPRRGLLACRVDPFPGCSRKFHPGNGPVSNMPEFAAAFACKVPEPMARAPGQRVIW
jgi:predicted metalloendopeptidase